MRLALQGTTTSSAKAPEAAGRCRRVNLVQFEVGALARYVSFFMGWPSACREVGVVCRLTGFRQAPRSKSGPQAVSRVTSIRCEERTFPSLSAPIDLGRYRLSIRKTLPRQLDREYQSAVQDGDRSAYGTAAFSGLRRGATLQTSVRTEKTSKACEAPDERAEYRSALGRNNR